MSKSVFGLIDNERQAEGIVSELKSAGFSNNDISVLFPDKSGTRDFAHEQHTKAPEGAATGAGTGGVLGGALGWLIGIGSLAIPGVGPFIAAGPIMERIPILKMGSFLLVTIQVDMHDELAMTLQEDLTNRVVKDRARGVLIDISSLEVVDSFIGRMIANIAGMARMLDAETVLVGMRPAVAITLVELGMSLPGVRTALNVNRGMAILQTALGAKGYLGGSA